VAPGEGEESASEQAAARVAQAAARRALRMWRREVGVLSFQFSVVSVQV